MPEKRKRDEELEAAQMLVALHQPPAKASRQHEVNPNQGGDVQAGSSSGTPGPTQVHAPVQLSGPSSQPRLEGQNRPDTVGGTSYRAMPGLPPRQQRQLPTLAEGTIRVDTQGNIRGHIALPHSRRQGQIHPVGTHFPNPVAAMPPSGYQYPQAHPQRQGYPLPPFQGPRQFGAAPSHVLQPSHPQLSPPRRYAVVKSTPEECPIRQPYGPFQGLRPGYASNQEQRRRRSQSQGQGLLQERTQRTSPRLRDDEVYPSDSASNISRNQSARSTQVNRAVVPIQSHCHSTAMQGPVNNPPARGVSNIGPPEPVQDHERHQQQAQGPPAAPPKPVVHRHRYSCYHCHYTSETGWQRVARHILADHGLLVEEVDVKGIIEARVKLREKAPM